MVLCIAAGVDDCAAAFAEKSVPIGKSQFAKLDGARIHYVNYGKGLEALGLIDGSDQQP